MISGNIFTWFDQQCVCRDQMGIAHKVRRKNRGSSFWDALLLFDASNVMNLYSAVIARTRVLDDHRNPTNAHILFRIHVYLKRLKPSSTSKQQNTCTEDRDKHLCLTERQLPFSFHQHSLPKKSASFENPIFSPLRWTDSPRPWHRPWSTNCKPTHA